MIYSLQDRLEILAKKNAFTGKDRPQIQDLVTDYLLRICDQATSLMRICKSYGDKEPTKGQKDIVIQTLVGCVNSTLLLMHFLEVEPPDNDSLNELLETLPDEIQQDKVLSVALINRSAADALLEYFPSEGEATDDMEDCLADIICGCVCVAELLGFEASELIASHTG